MATRKVTKRESRRVQHEWLKERSIDAAMKEAK